jgi:trans-aconitate 2-methyltransferase
VSATRDWDARSYHRLSDPHVAWAGAILDRLELGGGETVLDAGCGSGRVTGLLLERLPHGRVVAVDSAPSMVEQARAALPADRASVIQADLTALELDAPVDAVFSCAVFHWIADHDALFTRLHEALRPGGRLVAQCGGRGNIAGFRGMTDEVAAAPPFAEHLGGWAGPWHYAAPGETEERLRAAGFADARCWLEPSPVVPPEPREYIRTVCLGPHMERLPEHLREPYLDAVMERWPDPHELDYVRLNIVARR